MLGLFGGMKREILRLGPAWFAAGVCGIGLLGALVGTFQQPIQPVPAAWSAWPELARAHGAVLAIVAAACWWRPRSPGPVSALALLLIVWVLVFHAPAVWGNPNSVSARVAAAELLAMAAVAVCWAVRAWVAGGVTHAPRLVRSTSVAARIFAGLMLIVFGATHLQHREAIANMIPAWIPARAHWPWLTGLGNLLGGLALVSGVGFRLGGLLVGLMFASWIILVHLPRLWAAPASLVEWSFAAMTVAIVGAVWTAALATDAPGPLPFTNPEAA